MSFPTYRPAAAALVLFLAASASADSSGETPADQMPDAETLREALAFTRTVGANLPAIAGDRAGAREPDASINAGRGEVSVYIPDSYTPDTPTPLIILLHGYMNNGDDVENYIQLAQFVDSYGFLYVTPTGRSNFLGMEYWNATDACCDLFNNNPDDSAYLRGLIDAMQDRYNVDPRRIHFAGHSNGGFMSYRMACDHADIVASIASLAGATWDDPADCRPSEPVHTLQIHGTDDGVIRYNGGTVPLGGPHPSAPQTTLTWAAYDGCDPVSDMPITTFDLTTDIAGDDAAALEYVTRCNPGGSARLWTIPGGAHSPNLTQDFRTLVLDFLFAHPKPAPACPTDFDDSGTTDTGDLLTLLASFNSDDGGDVDGSGTTDTSDLLLVLAVFGQNCP